MEEYVNYEIDIQTEDRLIELLGSLDENINLIENATGARLRLKDGKIVIEGDEACASLAQNTVGCLLEAARKGERIDAVAVRCAVESLREGVRVMDDVIAITAKGRKVKCKTPGQSQYVGAMRKNTVVFAIGPAGTGKTYLAMAMAVVAFKNKEVERIILTRPAVEAGEKLGFLPGDLQNKVDPYLRPLYDALYDFMGADGYKRLSERGVVEVAPLAYMRGRTLSNAYIILDEAQNCTIEQMKMFLTRFGEGSKVVVTGDVTQTDLPPEKTSGLKHAVRVLRGVEGISTVYLTHKDVVRHELVQNIIRAYDEDGARKRRS